MPLSYMKRNCTIPCSVASLLCCSQWWKINDIGSIMLANDYVPNRIDTTCITAMATLREV